MDDAEEIAALVGYRNDLGTYVPWMQAGAVVTRGVFGGEALVGVRMTRPDLATGQFANFAPQSHFDAWLLRDDLATAALLARAGLPVGPSLALGPELGWTRQGQSHREVRRDRAKPS